MSGWSGATVEELDMLTDTLSAKSWSNPGLRDLVDTLYAEMESRKPELRELVTVGDFFVCSWGYDQTNVNYYEVVKVTKATVRVIPVAAAQVDDCGAGITHVAPLAGTRRQYDSFLPVDKPSTKRPTIYRHAHGWQVTLSMASYASASLWDCAPRYETALGWGH